MSSLTPLQCHHSRGMRGGRARGPFCTLSITSRCLNRRPRRPRTFRHSLRCCSCQCDNGQWPVTRDVVTVLGGVVPLPPEGISVPRWVTALVVTYVRRFPEYFGAMADCVDRALEWIDATSTRALLLGRS